MLEKRMEEALNKQLNVEFYSAYLYLSMSAQFESMNLKGFANWLYVQAQEELTHANKFYRFINERAGRVMLQKVDQPKFEWSSTPEAFADALKHEQLVTKNINDLVNLALETKDYATNIFLGWFVTEQVEEEMSVTDIIEKLKLLSEVKGGVYILDKELAARSFGG